MLIAIAHQKGGTSKTTLAFNLAIALEADQCFDLDSDKGGTTGLSMLAALRQHYKHPDLNVTSVHTKEELVEAIQSDTDEAITIMDLGGLDSDINRIALAYADLIISPANDSILEIGGVVEFSKILSEISKDIDRKLTAHIIAARTHHASKSWPDIENACDATENMMFSGVALPSYSDFSHSFAKGLSVSEFKPNSNATKRVKEIATYIKKLSA